MFANQSIAADLNAFVFKNVSGKLTLLNPNREIMPDQAELASRGLSVASRQGSVADNDRQEIKEEEG